MRIEHLAEGVQLICGDCREVLPTLPKVDAVVDNCGAVVYDNSHGKTATWEPKTPAQCGGVVDATEAGNRSALHKRGLVAGAIGDTLRDVSAGHSTGAGEARNPNQDPSAERGSERPIQRRHEKHDLSQYDQKDPLQSVRIGAATSDPSHGRSSYEQHSEQSGSSVFALSHEPSQARMVGLPQGWGIITDPPYGIGAHSGTGKSRRLRNIRETGTMRRPMSRG